MMTQREVDVFSKHALPGMALRAQRPAPKPLLKRCEGGCGVVVSQNKRRCLMCHQWELQKLLPKVRASLLKMEPEARALAIAGLPEEMRPSMVELAV